jgi:hypothetical protein
MAFRLLVAVAAFHLNTLLPLRRLKNNRLEYS